MVRCRWTKARERRGHDDAAASSAIDRALEDAEARPNNRRGSALQHRHQRWPISPGSTDSGWDCCARRFRGGRGRTYCRRTCARRYAQHDRPICYVLNVLGVADLVVLEKVCAAHGLPAPLAGAEAAAARSAPCCSSSGAPASGAIASITASPRRCASWSPRRSAIARSTWI